MISLRTKASRLFISMATAVAVIVSGLMAAPTSAFAAGNTSMVEGTDAAAAMFNPLNPIRIDMTIPTATWDFIQNDIYTTTYKRAFMTFTMNGEAVLNPFNAVTPTEWEVGIRLKGRASRRDLNGKAPFKIKMDKFVAGQTIFGLEKLTLNNMVQDPSMVREAAVFRLFRNMGVPAPRTGYAEVYVTSPGQVTNEYYGLYLNIETPDEVMLARWFGTNTAHLYESAYNTDVTTDYYSQYLDSIDVGSEDDVTDLTSFLPISDLTGTAWWDAVRERADMDEILALMGTDIFVSNWDGYTDFVRNNHYAHFDLDGTLSIMPWGNDQVYPIEPAFQFAFDGSNPDPRDWSNVRSIMYRRCVTVPECNYQLMRAIDDAAAMTSRLKLAKGLSRIVSVIDPLADADNRKEVSDSDFTSHNQFVIDYQADRLEEWSTWKTRLAPDSPAASVTCNGRRCTVDFNRELSTGMWAISSLVQQKIGGRWKKVVSTSRDSVTVTVKSGSNRFRVRSSNHFGSSDWASVTN